VSELSACRADELGYLDSKKENRREEKSYFQKSRSRGQRAILQAHTKHNESIINRSVELHIISVSLISSKSSFFRGIKRVVFFGVFGSGTLFYESLINIITVLSLS
jgi:hypothetical protein